MEKREHPGFEYFSNPNDLIKHSDKVLSKYGVDVYIEHWRGRFYHAWIFNGSKLIGDGWHICSDKKGFYTSSMTSKTGNLEGKQTKNPGWDKIISGGIAYYLSKYENTEDLIQYVPSEIWKKFPGLPQFIAKYDKKILEAPEGTYPTIDLELEEEIRCTDFKTGKRVKKNDEKSL